MIDCGHVFIHLEECHAILPFRDLVSEREKGDFSLLQTGI